MVEVKNKLLRYYKKNENFSNVLILVSLVFLVFYNSLNSYLIEVDDFSVFLHTKRSIADVFLTNTFGGNQGYNYRPFEVLAHLFDISVYGEESVFGRHLTNIVLHALCVITVYFLTYELTKRKLVGLIAGILFAINFIHTNSVTPVAWITGRIDVIVTFFTVLTVLLFIVFRQKKSNWFYFLSFITFAIAILSKEMAATLPIIILVYLLIFKEDSESENDIGGRDTSLLLFAMVLGGIIMILAGLIVSPNLVEQYLSSDNMLKQTTVEKIEYLQKVFIISGSILAAVSGLFLILNKLSNTAAKFIFRIRYSIPYFLIFFLYLVVRFTLIGGLGGGYISESGEAVNMQFGIDSMMRDIFGLIGIIWPVSGNYNLTVFKLEIENPFLFHSISMVILIFLVIIIYKSIKSKKMVLVFGLLWIFITALPTNNILITPWQYNTKYLYLPLVGFCIFISQYINQLLELKFDKAGFINKIVFAIIAIITITSSFLIIKHNKLIGESGQIMKNVIGDLQNNYQSKISVGNKIFFITYPFSSISAESAMFIYPYMQDVLNYSDAHNGFGRKYTYSFILFSKDDSSEKIEITWKGENNFRLENVDLDKYYYIPKNFGQFDEEIRKIYKRDPPHPILQKIKTNDSKVETDDAVITVSDINQKTKKATLEVHLKDSDGSPDPIKTFFVYIKDHLELVMENS